MAKKPKAWAHLPNAALIDAVLADVTARPDVWRGAWYVLRDAARAAAWGDAWAAARNARLDAAREAAWGAARDATRGVIWTAAPDVIRALVAWDDCAHLLDLPSDTLRTMADLCEAPVCHQAVMLLPYVLVREGTNEPCRQVTPA